MAIRTLSPSEPRSETMGIVLFNHLGSSVTGDTADDGASACEALGLHVISAERPGSAWSLPGQGRRLAADYIGAMSRLARDLILPEIEALGLQEVILWGRSAGGHGALVAGATEQLPVAAVHAQDAIGWKTVTPRGNRQAYLHYRRREVECMRKPESGLQPFYRPRVSDAKRFIANASRAAFDISNHQAVWSKPLAAESARRIAAGQPETELDLWFAADTYTLGQEDIAALETELRKIRGHGAGAPVNLRVAPGTMHASFDSRPFSTSLLARTVENVLVNR